MKYYNESNYGFLEKNVEEVTYFYNIIMGADLMQKESGHDGP